MQPRPSSLALRGTLVLAAATLLMALPAPTTAQTTDSNPEWQPVYDRLMREIMSPFCQGLTLADCPTRGAAEMRTQIRDWLVEGRDRSWIEEQLVAQYGPSVLGAPRLSGWGLLAWVTPPLALFFGLVGVASFLRRRQEGPGDEETESTPARADTDDKNLSAIAQRVEREIGDLTG